MSETQDQYIRKYLRLFRGMVGEVQSKRILLRDRLRKYPEQVEEIKLQLGGLEGEMDALTTTIEFIENWPSSCPLCMTERCRSCEYVTDCPITAIKCDSIESRPTVVVTNDGRIAANAGVTVIEVDDEEASVKDDVLAIHELPEKVLDILDE